MYEYKHSLEISFSHWRTEIPVILFCSIYGGETEVITVAFDTDEPEGMAAAKSEFMQSVLDRVKNEYDFEHLHDAILSEAIADREADRADQIIDAIEDLRLGDSA